MTATVGCKIPVGLAAALRAAGVPPAQVLASARLPSRLFDLPGHYVSPPDYFALWRAIRAISGNPAIGIVLAQSVKPELTEPLFLAILSAVDLAGAVTVVSRFKRLLEPEVLRVREDAVAKEVTVTYEWPGCEDTVPQVLVDAELAFLVEIGRRGTGDRDLSPREIGLHAIALEGGAEHAAFFRCAIRLGAPNNGIVFAAEDTRRSFVTHNPELLDALLPHLRQHTSEPATSTAARVRSVIAERIRGQRPEAQTVARELAMSTRAMQRLLKASGTSFRHVLDEVRNEHARGYLASTSFSDGEVSFLLGFDDPNSFYRAFRSWNGMSPSEFRKHTATAV